MAKRSRTQQSDAPPRFVRFLATVEGPGVLGQRVDAGDVARDPYPEALEVVPHEPIDEPTYRLEVHRGHANPVVEQVS